MGDCNALGFVVIRMGIDFFIVFVDSEFLFLFFYYRMNIIKTVQHSLCVCRVEMHKKVFGIFKLGSSRKTK